jgi:hypothetical protein
MSLRYCNGQCVLRFIAHSHFPLNIRLYSTDLFISSITSVPCSNVTCAGAEVIYRVFRNECRQIKGLWYGCCVDDCKLICYALVSSVTNVLVRIPMEYFVTNTCATSKRLVGGVDTFLCNRRMCWTRQTIINGVLGKSQHNMVFCCCLFNLTTCFGLFFRPSSGHKIYIVWGNYDTW